MDKDSPDDMKWVCDRAEIRAKEFGIEGVTYTLTMGVVKNIIPAIASTNALISAACVSECVKILTAHNVRVDNYTQFLGQTRVSCIALQMEMDPNCLVCGARKIEMEADKDEKLEDFVVRLCEKFSIKDPSILPETHMQT